MKTILRAALVLISFLGTAALGSAQAQRIVLDTSTILVDASEPSYVQYASKDLASYLTEISGKPVLIDSSLNAARKAKTIIAVGEKMATLLGANLTAARELGYQGSIIRSFAKNGSDVIAVAGSDPHGTNAGIATLMQRIRADGRSPYIDGPLDLRNKPSFELRGIHLNGWPLNYPYAFRSWKEALRRYRLGAAHQSLLPVALHGNSARAAVERRRSVLAGSATRRRLREEPAWHGGLDHAVGQSHRHQ
jgi:hypothetical protein